MASTVRSVIDSCIREEDEDTFVQQSILYQQLEDGDIQPPNNEPFIYDLQFTENTPKDEVVEANELYPAEQQPKDAFVINFEDESNKLHPEYIEPKDPFATLEVNELYPENIEQLTELNPEQQQQPILQKDQPILLESINPSYYDIISYHVALASQTMVHLSMVFNLFLMDLCNEYKDNYVDDEMWSSIFLGDDIYDTCIRFLVIPNYRERVIVNKFNSPYVTRIDNVLRRYFNGISPNTQYATREHTLNFLNMTLINVYRERFLNMLRETFPKRQLHAVNKCMNKGKTLASCMVKAINNKSINESENNMLRLYRNNDTFKDIIFNHQTYVRVLNDDDFEYRSFKIVRYLYWISRTTKDTQFSVAPVNKICTKFIDITNVTLKCILRKNNVTISDVFYQIPKTCHKLITDGIVCYLRDYGIRRKCKMDYRIRDLCKTFPLRNANEIEWESFLNKYMKIRFSVWD